MKYTNQILENNDKSGKMFNMHFVKNNHIEIYNDIIDYSNKNNLQELQFKEKVYHYVYDIPKRIICKNPNCNNETKFKNSTLGYNEYCSIGCISSDPNIKKIKENKSFQKFGTKTPAESNVVKNKMLKTNQERYGSNSPLQNEKIKQKSVDTLFKNYGVDNPNKSLIVKENKLKKIINEYKEKYNNFISIDFNERIIKFNCEKGHKFEINYQIYLDRKRLNTEICTICNPINSSSCSGYELQLQDFIKENYNGDIIFNNQKLIYPYEIDIYIPSLKLTFEFNGLYWHSELNKPDNYHFIKTEECEKKEIRLIHIYEDEWIYKQDIVKSRILNLIGKSKKIYARKCEIKEISNKESKLFLNENHIQGFVNSKYNIGLYYDNELVSLMTFSKVKNIYKMDRFCSKLNYNVIGGASKLFNYFIKTYNPDEITTFADRSWSQGDLYYKLNFKLIHKTKPNYYYIVDKIRKHRFNFRKDILIKHGFDKNKSEHEIMLERGIYRIYNSGHLKYVWKKINLRS